jgi:hypothetical protein
VRALGDKRLSAIHFRVLGAVARHDRLSTSRQGGQGCWAKNETLAKLCGVNLTNLSTAINELGGWGYARATAAAKVQVELNARTTAARMRAQ